MTSRGTGQALAEGEPPAGERRPHRRVPQSVIVNLGRSPFDWFVAGPGELRYS